MHEICIPESHFQSCMVCYVRTQEKFKRQILQGKKSQAAPYRKWGIDFTGHPSNHFSGCRLKGWLSIKLNLANVFHCSKIKIQTFCNASRSICNSNVLTQLNLQNHISFAISQMNLRIEYLIREMHQFIRQYRLIQQEKIVCKLLDYKSHENSRCIQDLDKDHYICL